MSAAKPFAIDKWRVYEAYQAVKANAGAAGVDRQTIADFEEDLKGNLYKIWNRRGWLMYYGRYYRSAMDPVFRHFNKTLVAWAMKKFKRLRHSKTRASILLEQLSKRAPHLFVHWQQGMAGAFA